MKSVKTYAGIAFLTFAMASCSQDEPAIIQVEPGTEIVFGANLTPDKPTTKTYYGPETNGVWPVYWNDGTKGTTLDQIFVYSPQAANGRNQAIYTVHPDVNTPSNAASITKVGSVGIQSGSTPSDYNFYGMYPSSAVKGEATGTTIPATLSGTQNIVFTGTNTDKRADAQLNPTTAVENAEYFTKPDMTQALLTCREIGVKLEKDKAVPLQFKPFASCLDITINGPQDDGNQNKIVYVTELRIEETTGKQIAGDFTYDFSSEKINASQTNANLVTIDLKDANGNGVPMTIGGKLHVQAFILPTEVSGLKVTVVSSSAKTWSKTLNLAHMSSGDILPVNLPKINVDNAQFDYQIWLSQLNPNIYISEVSLPGSANTFSKDATDALDRTQTMTLDQQFNAGIRVFQSHVWIADQTSSADGGSTSIVIAPNGTAINNTGGTGYLTLYDVVKDLTDQMASKHAEEFCVLLLSDYSFNNKTYQDFFKRLKAVLDSEVMQKYIVTNFTPETTIGDIKGKVLVKLAANNSGSSNFGDLNGANALFNLWTSDSSTQLNYSSLIWKNVTSANLTNSTSFSQPGANQMLLIHAEQSNPVSISWAPIGGYSYNWDQNASSQITAYHNQYDSTNHNIFGVTYLGGSGARSGTGNRTVSTEDVAAHYNPIWTNAVGQWTGTNNKPYGWVLVNMVGINSSNNVIQKVIEQNNVLTNLKRRPVTNTSPQGARAKRGGKLF